MKTEYRSPWYYHSFDDHNDGAWRNYWLSGDDDYDRGYGYGGFTLYYNLDLRVVGISLCSLKDRFNKKIGRSMAEAIAVGFRSTNNDWYVLCPTPVTCSRWTALMLQSAKEVALHELSYVYPHVSISFYTPDDRSKEAIWKRHADAAFEAEKLKSAD